ncbi:MAG: ATP-binding cassette domain-containing protein [Candidatus Heimdallarchaeota archaeon]|nr:ATP-binding cassette domain-containing protein [Candidatus Heimdallarchaeota archaeon]
MSIMQILNQESNQLLLAKEIYSIYKGMGDQANVVALSGVNLGMKMGEFVSIVGPSGSGKSSLLRILGGLQHPSAGTVHFGSKEVSKIPEDELVDFRRSTVGYVFQEGNLIPTQSAFMNLVQTLRFAGVERKEARNRAVKTLEQLGIKHRMNALPSKLSGGERQRVAIGRALITKPKLILADEPTGNLDYANSESVMGLFQDLHNAENTAFLVVTHSKHISRYADRSIELRDGQFVGEHGKEMDFDNLEKSRKIRIKLDGGINLPLEMMSLVTKYGELWDFSIEEENNYHKIVARPSVLSTGNGHSYTACPVCKSSVTSKDGSCGSCGAKLL